jgi:hypothetical protein
MINNYGFKDILIVGNHYDVKVETGYRLLLISNVKNNYKLSESSNSE